MDGQKLGIALLGAGIFACTQYVPTFSSLTELATLRAVWSRSQEVALKGAELVKDYSPDVLAKWGDEGLEQILTDESIHAVAIVLPAQVQLDVVIKALKAGKHVLQEKPVGTSKEATLFLQLIRQLSKVQIVVRVVMSMEGVAEIRDALKQYHEIGGGGVARPIWAVAENYRFEPALSQAAKWVKKAGSIVSVHMTAETTMNTSNPYFSSAWRRDPGLKICGAEVTKVSASVRHLEPTLPPPDNVSALFHMDNGCTGTMLISFSAVTKKIGWRVLCARGTIDVERSTQNGEHGYLVEYTPLEGNTESFFGPFSGVQDEIRFFVEDVAKVVLRSETSRQADPRSQVSEAASDVAVIEAILKSSDAKGAFTAVE